MTTKQQKKHDVFATATPSHFKIRCPTCGTCQGDPLNGGSWTWKKEHVDQIAKSKIKLVCSAVSKHHPEALCNTTFCLPYSNDGGRGL